MYKTRIPVLRKLSNEWRKVTNKPTITLQCSTVNEYVTEEGTGHTAQSGVFREKGSVKVTLLKCSLVK